MILLLPFILNFGTNYDTYQNLWWFCKGLCPLEEAKLLWFYSKEMLHMNCLENTDLLNIEYMIYPLFLFIWYILLKSVMVGDIFVIVQLNEGVEHNLQEWIQLGKNQPNINHPNIGGGWKFCHHTKKIMSLNENIILR